nr:MAG TPA: hypothetical protein [Caudoviricetes sp.]
MVCTKPSGLATCRGALCYTRDWEQDCTRAGMFFP